MREDDLRRSPSLGRRRCFGLPARAFRGELSEAQLARVKLGLRDIINEERDSICLYILREARWVRKEVLGLIRGETENIV